MDFQRQLVDWNSIEQAVGSIHGFHRCISPRVGSLLSRSRDCPVCLVNSSGAAVHINLLEMMAVQLALSHMVPHLRDQAVIVQLDNNTVVSYINRDGGMKSRQLDKLAPQLGFWCLEHSVSLTAVHIAGADNLIADQLCRPMEGLGALYHNRFLLVATSTGSQPAISAVGHSTGRRLFYSGEQEGSSVLQPPSSSTGRAQSSPVHAMESGIAAHVSASVIVTSEFTQGTVRGR